MAYLYTTHKSGQYFVFKWLDTHFLKHLKFSKDLKKQFGTKGFNIITDTGRLREWRQHVLRRRNMDDEVKMVKGVKEPFKQIITLMISVANSAQLEFCCMSVMCLSPSPRFRCSSKDPSSEGSDCRRHRLKPTRRAGGHSRWAWPLIASLSHHPFALATPWGSWPRSPAPG